MKSFAWFKLEELFVDDGYFILEIEFYSNFEVNSGADASFSFGTELIYNCYTDIEAGLPAKSFALVPRWDVYSLSGFSFPKDEFVMLLKEDFLVTKKYVPKNTPEIYVPDYDFNVLRVYEVKRKPQKGENPLKPKFYIRTSPKEYNEHPYNSKLIYSNRHILTPIFYVNSTNQVQIVGNQAILGNRLKNQSYYNFSSIVISDIVNNKHQEVLNYRSLVNMFLSDLNEMADDIFKETAFAFRHVHDNTTLSFLSFKFDSALFYGEDEVVVFVSTYPPVGKVNEDFQNNTAKIVVEQRAKGEINKQFKLFCFLGDSSDTINGSLNMSLTCNYSSSLSKQLYCYSYITYQLTYKKIGQNWQLTDKKLFPYLYFVFSYFTSLDIFYMKYYDSNYKTVFSVIKNQSETARFNYLMTNPGTDTSLFLIWKPMLHGNKLVPYGKPIIYNPNIYSLSNLPSDYKLNMNNNTYILCTGLSRKFFGFHNEISSNVITHIPQQVQDEGYKFEYSIWKISGNSVLKRTPYGIFSVENDNTFTRHILNQGYPVVFYNSSIADNLGTNGLRFNSDLEALDSQLYLSIIQNVYSYMAQQGKYVQILPAIFFLSPDLYVMPVTTTQNEFFTVFYKYGNVIGLCGGASYDVLPNPYTPRLRIPRYMFLDYNGNDVVFIGGSFYDYIYTVKLNPFSVKEDSLAFFYFNYEILNKFGCTQPSIINVPPIKSQLLISSHKNFFNEFYINEIFSLVSSYVISNVCVINFDATVQPVNMGMVSGYYPYLQFNGQETKFSRQVLVIDKYKLGKSKCFSAEFYLQ